MVLFTATDFPSSTVDTPVGETPPVLDTGVISIIKSDGIVEQVFDTLTTALTCLNFMNSRGQYYIMGGDDITIVNCQTKLLILENTFINQKMLNSFVFTYHDKSVMGIHRNLSNLSNLTDALISVGLKVSSVTPWNNNDDLETSRIDSERPRIKVVDWYYFSGVNGSLLSDASHIIL